METFDEKRKHERFGLFLPCLLSMDDDNVLFDSIELKTYNLSAGGALLEASKKTCVNVSVTLDIIIPPQIIRGDAGCGTYITAGGSIVRSSDREIAVAFREDYRIAPLDQVLRFIGKKVGWIERQRALMKSNEPESVFPFDESNTSQNNGHILLEKF